MSTGNPYGDGRQAHTAGNGPSLPAVVTWLALGVSAVCGLLVTAAVLAVSGAIVFVVLSALTG